MTIEEQVIGGITYIVKTDDKGRVVRYPKPADPPVDNRPFCQLLVGTDDSSGFVSAWDDGYEAFLFETGQVIKIQGTLAMDQALSSLVPGEISFRTPIVRNEEEGRVVLLTFVDGSALRDLTVDRSGIYRVTAENANKVRLLDPNGKVVEELKIIISE